MIFIEFVGKLGIQGNIQTNSKKDIVPNLHNAQLSPPGCSFECACYVLIANALVHQE